MSDKANEEKEFQHVYSTGTNEQLYQRQKYHPEKQPQASPAVIYSLILSFSQYVGIYSMLIARLGTRCDCMKLRAKSEVVRRRSVKIAIKCQCNILSMVPTDSLQDVEVAFNPPLFSTIELKTLHRGTKSSAEVYRRLLYLHSSGLEYLLEQLFRTAQLARSFSLNIGRSLTSALVPAPQNFIYSGLMEVEQPRRNYDTMFSEEKRQPLTSNADAFLLRGRSSVHACPYEATKENLTDPFISTYLCSLTTQRNKQAKSSCSVKFNQISDSQPRSKKCGRFRRRLKIDSNFRNLSKDARSLITFGRSKNRNIGLQLPLKIVENRHKTVVSDVEFVSKLIYDINVIKCLIQETSSRLPKHFLSKNFEDSEKEQENEDIHDTKNSVASQLDKNSPLSNVDSFNVNQTICPYLCQPEQKLHIPSCLDAGAVEEMIQKMNSVIYEKHGQALKLDSDPSFSSIPRRNSTKSVTLNLQADEDSPKIVTPRQLKKSQCICLCLIVAFSVGIFGAVLGTCVYLLT